MLYSSWQIQARVGEQEWQQENKTSHSQMNKEESQSFNSEPNVVMLWLWEAQKV